MAVSVAALTCSLGVSRIAPLSKVRTLSRMPLRSFNDSATHLGIRTANELPHAAIFMSCPFVNDSQNNYCLKLARDVYGEANASAWRGWGAVDAEACACRQRLPSRHHYNISFKQIPAKCGRWRISNLLCPRATSFSLSSFLVKRRMVGLDLCQES